MNRQRRKQISNAVTHICRAVKDLEDAHAILEREADGEQDAVDNTPEAFQSTDRYYDSEAAADTLSDAASSLSDIISDLQGIL